MAIDARVSGTSEAAHRHSTGPSASPTSDDTNLLQTMMIFRSRLFYTRVQARTQSRQPSPHIRSTPSTLLWMGPGGCSSPATSCSGTMSLLVSCILGHHDGGPNLNMFPCLPLFTNEIAEPPMHSGTALRCGAERERKRDRDARQPCISLIHVSASVLWWSGDEKLSFKCGILCHISISFKARTMSRKGGRGVSWPMSVVSSRRKQVRADSYHRSSRMLASFARIGCLLVILSTVRSVLGVWMLALGSRVEHELLTIDGAPPTEPQ